MTFSSGFLRNKIMDQDFAQMWEFGTKFDIFNAIKNNVFVWNLEYRLQITNKKNNQQWNYTAAPQAVKVIYAWTAVSYANTYYFLINFIQKIIFRVESNFYECGDLLALPISVLKVWRWIKTMMIRAVGRRIERKCRWCMGRMMFGPIRLETGTSEQFGRCCGYAMLAVLRWPRRRIHRRYLFRTPFVSRSFLKAERTILHR